MEYQNAGIRHIAIRKKDEIYDDFDPMFGEFYGTTDKNESVQKDKESSSDSGNSDNKYDDKEKYSVCDIHKHKDRESSSDSDDEENYNNDKAKQKNRYSFSDSDDENSSNSENERTSDNETFRVSPQPNISEEEEQDEDERNDVDEDEMNLASLLNAVDEINISLKQKDEKSIHEQKKKKFSEKQILISIQEFTNKHKDQVLLFIYIVSLVFILLTIKQDVHPLFNQDRSQHLCKDQKVVQID